MGFWDWWAALWTPKPSMRIDKDQGVVWLTLRTLEAARKFPQVPTGVGLKRGMVHACTACASTLEPIVATTGGPFGVAEVWRAHPLAVDGWRCPACQAITVPAFLTPEEATALNLRGAQCAQFGNLDEAELCFLRVVTSWADYAPGRVNLGSLYQDRLRLEGEKRPDSKPAWIGAMRANFRAALSADPPIRGRGLAHVLAALAKTEEEEAFLTLLRSLMDAELADEDRMVVVAELATRLHASGAEIVRPHLRIEAQRGVVGAADAVVVRRGIAMLEESLVLREGASANAWATAWCLGKARQAVGDFTGARDALRLSFQENPDQPNVAREYSLACIALEDHAEAERVARHAVSVCPDDAGLQGNLGLTLLLLARPAEAVVELEAALVRDPSDGVNRALLRIAAGVSEGRIPQPRSLSQMERDPAFGP